MLSAVLTSKTAVQVNIAIFRTNGGQKAYSDKTKGAEFIEFLRRRLILSKEILAYDGSIFVHFALHKIKLKKRLLKI